MRPEKEGRLLRAIAAELARDMAMPYRQLAEAVGVGRRTLYRIATNREALLERLRIEAVAATGEAVGQAIAHEGSFLDAFRTLTREFVTNGALYEFWAADAFGREPCVAGMSERTEDLLSYEAGMTALLERGRREGALRSDIPVAWLLSSYDGLLLASSAYRRAGRSAERLDDLVIAIFLRGAGVEPVGATTGAMTRRGAAELAA